MITVLNRREVLVTRRLEDMNRAQERLSAAGVQCLIRTNSLTNPGRSHGIPGIRADFAYEYRIYVHRKDLE